VRKLSILVTVALCSLAMFACGGGSAATPTPTPDFETAAQAQAPSVPLVLSDMPEGWEPAAEGDTDLTQSAELPPGCNIFDLHVAFPNAFVTAAGPHFHNGGKQVTSYGAIYRTTDEARRDVDGTHDTLDRCADDYKSAVENIANDQLSALGIHLGFLASVDVTLVEQPETTADGSRLYQLQAKVSLPGDDLTFTLDARVVRVGRVIGALTYYTQGEGGTNEERDITGALTASVTEADGALPQ
jgi:hypothetical protein